MTASGKDFLKVIGILYIVVSAWSFFSHLLGDLTMGAVLFLLPSYRIYMGFIGVKYCNILEKAHKLRRYAIADLVLCGINFLLGSIFISPFYVLDHLPTLSYPILYLIGASKNITAYNTREPEVEIPSSEE